MANPTEEKRGKRKVRQGVVVSNKMDKTIVVEVTRQIIHPVFKKFIRKHKLYHVHDEKNECGVGDMVQIVETRPLSKTKRWRLLKIVEKAA